MGVQVLEKRSYHIKHRNYPAGLRQIIREAPNLTFDQIGISMELVVYKGSCLCYGDLYWRCSNLLISISLDSMCSREAGVYVGLHRPRLVRHTSFRL